MRNTTNADLIMPTKSSYQGIKCLGLLMAIVFVAMVSLQCSSGGTASPSDNGGGGGGGGGGSPDTVAAPTFSPAPGSYSSAQSVTITTTTAGATICYRTDGSDPSAPTAGTCGAGSSTYSGPVNISTTTTLKAIGTKSGMINSSVTSGTYTIDTMAPTPGTGITFSGTTDTQTTVSWGAGTDNVTPSNQLQYRLMRSLMNNLTSVSAAETNGTEVMPYTTNTTSHTATGLTASTTYYFAVIVRDQAGNKALYTQQSVTTSAAGSVAAPSFSPAPGTFNSAQSVTITTATSGATICYRTDGTDPTAPTPGTCGTGSTTYSGPVNISTTTTLKAIGTKSGMTNSSVTSGTYTIDTTAPTVSSTTPANSATGIVKSTTVAVTFSEAMNTSTISTTTNTTCTGSLQVSADNFATCVPMTSATPTASGGDTVFTMTPASHLASATNYKIRVTTAVQDVAGNALASTFTTATGFTVRYYHTITIDGTNDFTANETFTSTSGGYQGYLAWDDDYIYIGMTGADVNANNAMKWIVAYIAGSGGSSTGVQYNTQQANMPTGYQAKYHVRWKSDNSFTNAQSYSGTWSNAGWNFSGNVWQNGTYFEMRIARSDIGLPTTLGLIMNMLNETNMSEWTYAGVPSAAFTDGYDPNYTKYLSCTLNTSNQPNTACNVLP